MCSVVNKYGTKKCPFTGKESVPFYVSAIPRWWLRHVGGVDVRYKDGYGYEDMDLTIQSMRDGIKHVHHMDLCALHRGPADSVWQVSPERDWRFAINLKEFCNKWGLLPYMLEQPGNTVEEFERLVRENKAKLAAR
jgi:hypothetical protein